MSQGTKRRKIFNMLDGRCFYCGCELNYEDFHLDHFKPKSSGGTRNDNLVPSCTQCNLFKSNLDIESFRNKIAMLPFDDFHGKIISKYFNIQPKPIVFYFEEVGYGDL